MEVEGPQYGGTGAYDTEVDFESRVFALENGFEIGDFLKGRRGVIGSYIRVKALPTPTQVTSSESTSQE